MPAKNPRVHVSLDPDTIHMLNYIAQKDKKSLSNIAQELIQEALELREDYYLCKLAEESEKRSTGKPTIPAEKIWKELGIE